MKVKGILDGILLEQRVEITQKVVSDILKEWDKAGEGSFSLFLVSNFANFWVWRVSQN